MPSGFFVKDKVLKENFKSDDRAGTQRVLRTQREVAKEEYTTAQLQAAREAQERTHRLRAQDERLATELAKRKTEKVRQEMNVQRRRHESSYAAVEDKPRTPPLQAEGELESEAESYCLTYNSDVTLQRRPSKRP